MTPDAPEQTPIIPLTQHHEDRDHPVTMRLVASEGQVWMMIQGQRPYRVGVGDTEVIAELLMRVSRVADIQRAALVGETS